MIHPFSGSPRKNWPLEKFHALADRLERMMPVKWCAGEDDPPLPGAVRIDDLYDLACWLARARLFVGNDSGITHLAAAVATPVLAIFGPTDPEVWAPRGNHVRIGGGDNGDNIEERGNSCEPIFFLLAVRRWPRRTRRWWTASAPPASCNWKPRASRRSPERAGAGLLADPGLHRHRSDQLRPELGLGPAPEGAAGRDSAPSARRRTRTPCARSPISPSSSGPIAAITTR